MKKKYIKSIALASIALAGLSSCSKDDAKQEEIPTYEVPTTYNFQGADYNSSSIRIKQMLELDAYLRTANADSALSPQTASSGNTK